MPAKCFIASHLWCMEEMEKYVACRQDWLLLQQDLDLANPQLLWFFGITQFFAGPAYY